MTKNRDFSKQEFEQLLDELASYKNEKEKLRNILGQIGGRGGNFSKIITVVFVSLVLVLFLVDLYRNMFYYENWSSVLTVEIGLFLVSIKLIWMMHLQSKVGHFQFWILNAIEFKVNRISKKINELERKLK